jgi:radical SAM superfamily enzyme YgiQ (UPF0313 family)
MADRLSEQIARWLDANLYRFDGPSQYAGDEPGAVCKEWDSAALRWLMVASWPYEQASGNMSIPAVYKAINDAGPGYLCDRFYLPATARDLKLLERGGVPVFGIESKHPLRDFDVVGTSISYTVLFMNFCKMLTMSGMPLRRWQREERAGDYPMVMVGGQAYCAPEFMSAVADCIWLGEVEDEPGNGGISQVLERIEQFKAAGDWADARQDCYDALAREFPYLYFPSTVAFSYRYEDRGLPHPSKQVSGHRPLLAEMSYPFRARKVKNLDQMKPLTEIPLLYSDPGMGAGDIEAARGCPAWCSFCRLSWVTKPYRQHSVGYSTEQARQWRRNMGSLEISPFGPDFPMHTEKKALLGALLEQVSDEVSSSSMRVDDFNADPDFSMIMAIGGMDSITLGLEGNSQRMRDLAGKGTSDDDVAEAVTRAIRAGIRKIKLYMISNWPGEEPGDVMRIVELGRRLAEIREGFGDHARGVRIQFSWTPLLIEAQTPLQWFAPTPPDYTLQEALNMLRDLRIDMKIGTKAAPEKLAFFQACQRASREAGEAIVDVIAELDSASWGGFAKDMKDRLDAALVRRGFLNGLDDLFGERYEDDLFGWEHIGTGVSRQLMWETYQRMLEFLVGTDSETYDGQFDGHYHGNEWVPRCDQTCQGARCGACDHEDLRLRTSYIRAATRERDLDLTPVTPLDQTTVAMRIRARVARGDRHRFVTPEHWKHAIRRAAYRAQDDLDSKAGISKRSVRLASESLRYRDRSSGVDYVDFGVTRAMGPAERKAFMGNMAAELGHWLQVEDWTAYPAAAAMNARPVSLWELEVDASPEALSAALRAWDAAESVPVLLRSESFYAGETVEEGDAREHVADLWVTRDRQHVRLSMMLTGKLGPYQAYAALMGKASWIDAAVHTARRVDFFEPEDDLQGSVVRPVCLACGRTIPGTLLGKPFDMDYCPRCKDDVAGVVAAGLSRAGV